jgi:hypothetical protein
MDTVDLMLFIIGRYDSTEWSISLSTMRIRLRTANTARKAFVQDSSASVLCMTLVPGTVPTIPNDDMPMLADNLIGCPAILSLVMLRDNRIVRERYSDKITIYTHSSPPDAQPFFFDLPYEINCLKQSSMPIKA